MGSRNQTVRGIGAAALLAFIVAVTLTVAGSSDLEEVATQAVELDSLNSTLGAAAVVRATTNQAVVFAVDHELGVASPEAATKAADEASAGLATLDSERSRLADTALELSLSAATALEDLSRTGQEVLAGIEKDDVAAAQALAAGDFVGAYSSVVSELGSLRALLLEAVTVSRDAAGGVGGYSGLFVSLLIPAAALAAFWFVTRRETDERQAEIQAALDAARDASSAKEAFIEAASNELLTPITSIYGLSDVLMESDRIFWSEMELVRLINHDSDDLGRIIENVLAAGRIESGSLEPAVQAFDVLSAIEDVVAPMIRLGLDITIECPSVEIMSDIQLFKQVLRNLLSNAERYGAEPLLVVAEPAGDRVKCSVVDHGDGLPVSVGASLFQQPDAAANGRTGLGLTVSRLLVEALGGKIGYDVEQERTTFTFYVPSSSAAAASDVEQTDPEPVDEVNRRHVTSAVAAASGPGAQPVAELDA